MGPDLKFALYADQKKSSAESVPHLSISVRTSYNRAMRKFGLLVIEALTLCTLLLFWEVLAVATSQRPDLLETAALKVRAKDFSSAEDLIRRVLAKEPTSSKAYNLLGICQAAKGQYQAAREAFEKAIALNPKVASAHVNLGNLLLGLHEDTGAIKEFKAALAVDPSILTRDPTSYTAFNILGLCLMNDMKYVEALAAFKRSAQINPKYAPARVNMGNALVVLKRDSAALREFMAAIRIEPEDFVALYNIGLIYGRQGKFDAAANYLGKAHRLAPQDQAMTLALIGAEISSGKKQEARSLVDDWKKSGSLSPEARKQVALIWLENGEPGLAVGLVQGDAELSSLLYRISLDKAESQFENGRYEAAARELEAVRGLQAPDAAFHNLLGSIYYALDDSRKASDEFQEAIKLQPADPELYFKLGMVFLKHRTPDPAIYIYETALKNRPDVPKLWLGLGLGYYFASRLEDAERALRKALALDPRYEVAYVVLGDLLEQSGRTDDALEVFRKAVAVSPDLAMPYYYYGKLATKQQHSDLREAVEKLRRAVALKPDFAEAHFELGKALAQEGNMAEGLGELKKSLQLKPDLYQSHYQLGFIYKKLGNQSASEDQFRQFAEMSKKAQPEDLIQRLEVQIEKP
jgi:tetratricopeptide (TPR) repeat protein